MPKSTKTSKPNSKPNATKRPNKSAFVRAQPATMTAAEVVIAAAKEGLKITDKYVYNVRFKTKGRNTLPAKKRGRPKGSVNKPKGKPKPNGHMPKSTGSTGLSSRDRDLFIEMVLGLGLTTSEALIAQVRTAARSAALAS